MKTAGWIGIAAGMCVAWGCEPKVEQLTVDVKAKAVYANLQLYPVRANEVFLKRRKALETLLTLEEAVKGGKVVITELDTTEGSADAEVNRLFIENKSSDSVLILSGEMVIGGKQNRMIAQDVVLPPNSGKLDVDVFCVEHGRWTGDSAEFKVADLEMAIAPPKMRQFSNAKTNQQEVWDKVSAKLAITAQPSESGALADLKFNKRYVDSVNLYVDALNSSFPQDPDIIGVIAVVGDSIIACDLFATPDLFKKHFPKLLKSYSDEAAYSENTGPISPVNVEGYLAALVNDKERSGEFVARKEAPLKKRGVHLGVR